MKRILALDVGDKRIGVAMSDTLGILASPLKIIERTTAESDITAIIELAIKNDAGLIIVGLPEMTGGGIGHQAAKVKAFFEALKKRTSVALEMRDESFTSLTAQNLLREASSKKKKGKIHDDAAAAAVLLQGYLDELKADK